MHVTLHPIMGLQPRVTMFDLSRSIPTVELIAHTY
jgi:hypothetical protein